MSLISDLKFALRSLLRAKGLTLTVVVTLALGIGANAAIFSVVRGVLLRPLVNRDESRLIYIQQSARGLGTRDSLAVTCSRSVSRERCQSPAPQRSLLALPSSRR